ncbi:MAG: ferrous iron transport protein B [Lachnospiraceae bacterium]|nr:ferrous iron transport protein B [Lachnospiraceae bacterium]
MEELTIGFIGNPNCGKTTLFNAYTGANLKVANWPGVTVEKKEGAMRYHNHHYKLVDLPGTYSLTSYTMEEMVSRQYIVSDEVDVIVDVADASALERNLYLTLQLIELNKPVVLALNMMDIVEERGMEIDLHRLPEMLGIPVVPVSARKRTGLEILIHTVAHHKDKQVGEKIIHHHDAASHRHRHNHHKEYAMVYSDEVEDKIDAVIDLLKQNYPQMKNYRWHAIKILENDPEILEKYPADYGTLLEKNYEKQIINEKFSFIEEIIEECLVNKSEKEERTDKMDRLFTHPIWGMPCFLFIMAAVFFLTFTVGDWLKGYFETGLEWFSLTVTSLLTGMHTAPPLISLIVDGIISGVGGILTFLPNIFILFLALAFLEDSGYMSRVAYVMDSIMGRIGLSGRAFIPMLLGFGCTVPAIMATRTLENNRDRMKTMIITPFMSCSARLPIYVLFCGMFFKEHAMLAAYSMYIIGVLVAILVAYFMKVLDKKEEEQMLLIELPEYKSPNVRTIGIYVWEKVKDYLTKAGTTIFIASIIMWFILNFGPEGYTTDMVGSFGAMAGKVLVPFFRPTGLGYWQIILALISGIAAKEVVVSSTAVLFGIGNVASTQGMASLSGLLSAAGFGPLNAYVLMIFCLLYVPCAATIATIKRESKSTKFAAGMIVFQLATAWLMAFLVYQAGTFLMTIF